MDNIVKKIEDIVAEINEIEQELKNANLAYSAEMLEMAVQVLRREFNLSFNDSVYGAEELDEQRRIH